MGNIQRLNDHLTNMIAAGEVVERPSGVIKELIDNAIDAHATKIDVTIKEGGITYIQVKDNGTGMDGKDAVMAFERHATSKLKEEKDLWSIQTMGFRGEALPSIASVSQVTLLTNNKEESTLVKVHFGKLMEVKPYPAMEGTEITVENIFQKTPARLKHLKTKQYETAMIHNIIDKFALGYPSIAFTLVADGKQIASFNGSGKLNEVIYAIYGKEAAKNTVSFIQKDYDFTIEGALVLPTITRASNQYISLYVNHRMIRHYRLQKVVMEAFSDYLFSDRYPIVVLNIKADPQLADVNVHPTKWEIRLSKEQQLEQFIRETLKNVLRENMNAPQIQLKKEEKEKVEFTNFIFEDNVKEITPVIKIEPVYTVAEKETEVFSYAPKVKRIFPVLNVIGQLHGKYILAEGEGGLFIIDQHAAQERYNYEKFQRLLSEKKSEIQPLLLPVVIEANGIIHDPQQVIQMFEDACLTVELFGNNSLICREIPVWMQDIDIEMYGRDLLDYYKNNQKMDLLTLHDAALESLACHASVKFNQVLNMDEMKSVIENLQSCMNPFQCPHGRPTFIQLSDAQLKKEFLR